MQRRRDFRSLWFGESVSLLGDQVSALALPTAAVLVLGASATQVGALNAVGSVTYPVLGLVAGAVLDRVRRRPVLVVANVIRIGCFGVLTLSAAVGWLSMPLLYVLAGLVGIATLFFDLAYQTYLPSLLTGDDLARGNVRLELSNSLARLSGPSVGGLLLQYGGVAVGFGVNALSFVASLVGVGLIRTPEPAPVVGERRAGLWSDVGAGLAYVWRHPVLRSLTVSAALRNLGMNANRTVLIVYLYRGLDLSAGAVGLLFTVGAVGALAGVAATGWLVRRLGVGRTLLLTGLEGAVWLLVPLSLFGGAVAWVVGLMFVSSLWLPVWNATVITLRQHLTPSAYLGRVQATARTINLSTIPIGAFVGGVVADAFPTTVVALAVCSAVAALSLTQLCRQPLRGMRELPVRVE
ncbi:MFS transporter [Kribbella sp. NPDC058245]|uniref:MFS transporter n=1 Tax=Kribbella sp. NPDC058245 TaxID=3346399 RepID=UPI0036E7E051